MKKNEVPQDKSNFKDLCYAVDEKGNYVTETSSGWNPKSIALKNAMDDIDERTENARTNVLNGLSSPIEYYMELNKMDLNILSSYVGIWKWRVKRHLKPTVFNKLSEKTLSKYAEVFEVSLNELKIIKNEN